MATKWDEPTQKKFRDYTQLLLGFILGAVVFLPSIVGLTKPPLLIPWAVPITLTLIMLSIACLGVAMLTVVLGSDQPPFRLIGIGTWTGFGALLLLFVFVVANLIAASTSRPEIIAVKAAPIAVEPGNYVNLDVEASDKSGERLRYRWLFQDREISSLRNAYLKAPTTLGTYIVVVEVSNERATVRHSLQLEVLAETPPLPTPLANPTHP